MAEREKSQRCLEYLFAGESRLMNIIGGIRKGALLGRMLIGFDERLGSVLAAKRSAADGFSMACRDIGPLC